MQLLKQYELLGEDKNLQLIDGMLKQNSNFVANIIGDRGSGKTYLLNSINEILVNSNRKVLLNSFQEYEFENHLTILIDDVDEKITPNEFIDIIFNIFMNYEDVKIFFTSRNEIFTNKIVNIDYYILKLGHRIFDYDQFENWFEHIIVKRYNQEFLSKITIFIKKNIYLFAKHIKNYNNIFLLINSLDTIVNDSDINKSFSALVMKTELKEDLEKDTYIEKGTDENSYALNIRGKNTVEKLKDVIMKYYPDKDFLYKVLKSTYSNTIFIDEVFNTNISYEDIIIQLCFYYSPTELLTNLLGPRDIVRELDEREFDSIDYSFSADMKINIILRDVGLTILDKPKGISYYLSVLDKNHKIVNENMDTSMKKEYLISLGLGCYQELESIMFELINFYATYLSGSFSGFLEEYNKVNRQGTIEKITFEKYIDMVKFLNRLTHNDEFQMQMVSLHRKEIINTHILDNLDKLLTFRKAVSVKHSSKSSYYALKRLILQIYDLGMIVLNEFASINVFPEIIRIKKIILDEYGRKLVIATDWDDAEIRFSLSYDIEDLNIDSYYYLIRKDRNIIINPIIIERLIHDNHKLIVKQGSNVYQQRNLASNNEVKTNNVSNVKVNNVKGNNLQEASIEPIEDKYNEFMKNEPHKKDENRKNNNRFFSEQSNIEDRSKILVIGCGDGKAAIDLYGRNNTVIIDAFDSSKEKITEAFENMKNHKINQSQISFFVMNELNMDMENQYDFIYSNAALHWINNSEIMYKKIFKALRKNGKIEIHQGGFGSYRGLHKIVLKAMKELDILSFYEGWKYPVYYPNKKDIEDYLDLLGYKNINIINNETNEEDLDELLMKFSQIDMLPYIKVLKNDMLKTKLQDRFFEIARREKVDTYVNRLFITAVK